MRRALFLGAVLLVGCSGGERSLEVRVDREVRGTVERPSDARLHRRTPRSVDFVSGDVGLMSTEGGLVLGTRDGGVHWRVRASGQRLAQLSLVTPRLVYGARSGMLLRSEDGGRSWVRAGRLPRYPTYGGPSELQFFDRIHGWRSDTAAWSTSNGGRSWQRRFVCRHEEDWLGGISFLDARRGFAICGGQPATIEQRKELWATEDGGETWQLRERTSWFEQKPVARGGDVPSQGHVGPIAFRSDGNGWMSANRIGMYGTRDGGHRWRTIFFTGDLAAADMSRPGKRGFALVSQLGLSRTDDDGRRWRLLYPPLPGPPETPASPTSALDAIGIGASGLLRSRGVVVATGDGGVTWSVRSRIRGVGIQQLVRVSPTRVWAVAMTLPGNAWRLYRSEDDARTWRRVAGPAARYEGLDFATPSVGYLSTATGGFRTADGGRTWQRAARGVRYSGAEFATAEIGIRLGARGLLETFDGGQVWHAVRLPSRIGLLGVSILDERHWWLEGHVCGHVGPKGSERPCKGALLRTTDGGRRWELITLPAGMIFTDVQFASPVVGWAPGWGGGHWLTRDGGRSWRFVYPRWAS